MTESYKEYKNIEFIITSTLINYDSEQNYFNIGIVEDVIDNFLVIKSDAIIILTVTVGCTEKATELFN